MLAELVTRLREIQTRSDVRCLVLSAAGPWFCAGMDLTQMQEAAARPDAPQIWHGDTQLYHDVVKTLFELPMPTLAVVQGGAGWRLGLVLACDMTLATATALLITSRLVDRQVAGCCVRWTRCIWMESGSGAYAGADPAGWAARRLNLLRSWSRMGKAQTSNNQQN